MSPEDQAVRVVALKAKVTRETWKAQAAAMFLDWGITPEEMRRMRRNSFVADGMEAQLREEALIRRRLTA